MFASFPAVSKTKLRAELSTNIEVNDSTSIILLPIVNGSIILLIT